MWKWGQNYVKIMYILTQIDVAVRSKSRQMMYELPQIDVRKGQNDVIIMLELHQIDVKKVKITSKWLYKLSMWSKSRQNDV